jgi:biopolymer transport protein ExbB
MRFPRLACLAMPVALSVHLLAQVPIDDAIKQAAIDYGQRLDVANKELADTRLRIAKEQAPLLEAMRAAEIRFKVAEMESQRIESANSRSQDVLRTLNRDLDALNAKEERLDTIAHDSLDAFQGGYLPGERQLLGESVSAIDAGFTDPSKPPGERNALAVVDLLLDQVKRSLGGYTSKGSSIVEGNNELVEGTFAFMGPEVFFQPSAGGQAGSVRSLNESKVPVTSPIDSWDPASSSSFFRGSLGLVRSDASAGKALSLRETKGTLLQHINKGGVVSYAILCVGAFALGLIVVKVRDLRQCAVDQPEKVEETLDAVALGSDESAFTAIKALKPVTAAILTVGMRHRNAPRELLEEHLDSALLRQRLHFERWLPLLAVIATAAPLMGLLGTVTGMVRTFALITVFGTGNAGRLASGISEVLVSTELGLVVAVPTLVAHGFLSNRIQRNLSTLERYAGEFATAIGAREPGSSIPSPKVQ